MGLQKGISVITPVYNAEKYICSCVASLMLQTFKDLELIFVIDKNTTDNSENMLKELTAEKENVVILNPQNSSGAGYNRNFAIEKANREYIGFLDVDDYIAKNYYELLYNNAKKYNSDVVMGETVVLEENKEIRKIYEYPFHIFENINDIYSTLKVSTCWDKIYRTELLKNDKTIRFAEGVIHEDNIFTLNVFLKTDKLVSTPRAYYYWVKHNNSVTTSDDDKWDNDAYIVFNQILNTLKETSLKEEDKYKIITHNIRCYAIELFKKKQYYDYYRNILPAVIGKQKTYELIYTMEHHEPFD